MTEADRERFARALFALGDTFNEPVSELRAEAYFDALKDLPAEEVLRAMRTAIRDARFFPRPVEIREQIVFSVDEQSELAWVHVLQEVRRVGWYGEPRWPDDATRRAALELFGGWKRLCEALPGDGPALLGFAKQFKATFRSYAHREARRLANGSTGYLTEGDNGDD